MPVGGRRAPRVVYRWGGLEWSIISFLVTCGTTAAVVMLVHVPINRAINRRPHGLPRSWAVDITQAETPVLYAALLLGVGVIPIVAALIRRRSVMVAAVAYPVVVCALVTWGIAHDIAAGP